MTLLAILQYPDPRLRRTARQVTNVNEAHLQQTIDDMLETLHHTKSCAALAATQLAIDNPPSITVIAKVDGVLHEDTCLINPKIISKSTTTEREEEGCMSVYPKHVSALVERATEITVAALDRHGNPITISVHGFLAKCLQHEVDHLHGIIYLDYLSPLKLSLIKKKIFKTRAAAE
jgi:peptide deformylase